MSRGAQARAETCWCWSEWRYNVHYYESGMVLIWCWLVVALLDNDACCTELLIYRAAAAVTCAAAIGMERWGQGQAGRVQFSVKNCTVCEKVP